MTSGSDRSGGRPGADRNDEADNGVPEDDRGAASRGLPSVFLVPGFMQEVSIPAPAHPDRWTGPAGARPRLYTVVFVNDDVTPIDFVVAALRRYIGLEIEKAIMTTIRIQENGSGAAGLFPFEVAETRALQVTHAARRHGFPFNCHPAPT